MLRLGEQLASEVDPSIWWRHDFPQPKERPDHSFATTNRLTAFPPQRSDRRARWSRAFKPAPERRAASDRRALHYNEAGALQMFDEALRHDFGHDLVGVVNALAALIQGDRPYTHGEWPTSREVGHGLQVEQTGFLGAGDVNAPDETASSQFENLAP